MGEEYITNPGTVIAGGNIVGDELGYLENINNIQGYNSEITSSTIEVNNQTMNAALMSPVIGQLMVLYAENFRNYVNTILSEGVVKLAGSNLSGSAMSKQIVIFDRQEKITENILAVEVSNPVIMPQNILYSDSNVLIENQKYVFDSEGTSYFYGGYTSNQNYLILDPEETYTFSFYAKAEDSVKLLVNFYDQQYNLIESVVSDELIPITESRLYLTLTTPLDTVYASFEIQTKTSAIINKLMLNQGNLIEFISGYQSEIKNINFLNYEEIRFSHTADDPYGTSILYDVFNNGELYKSNQVSPFILETAELGIIEIKAKLLTNSTATVVSLTNLIVTGV